MASPEFRQVMRFFTIAGLVGLILLISAHFMGRKVSAESYVQPGYQGAYPGQETATTGPTSGYPGSSQPSATPGVTATTGTGPTRTAVQATSTPAATQTPASTLTTTATIQNVFGTENAEMGGSSITPPPSLTPLGTGTAAPTQTLTPTQTLYPTEVSGAGEDGWHMDWGFFWMGFAAPVVAACGVILYLLECRPDLFSRRK